MRVQLAQQAQEILGKSDLVIITERVDDVALLIGQMVKIGFVEVLDRHIPRHWQQRELSWGWTAVIWLAYILTEGDHRKVSVEAYIKGMQTTLSHLSGQVIDPLDFSDDRLGHLLKHLSQPHYWHRIEQDLNARSLEVYAWPQDVIRWVLSQSSIFGQNPKIGCQEFNDLQTPQLSKKQLCDRTRWRRSSRCWRPAAGRSIRRLWNASTSASASMSPRLGDGSARYARAKTGCAGLFSLRQRVANQA